jgi:hypothetical protein
MSGIVSLHRMLAQRTHRRVRHPQRLLIDVPLALAVIVFVALLVYAAWWGR